MLTQRSCCLLQRLSAAGPSLGSELDGTLLCGLQPGPTAAVAVVRKPRPTVNICSPDTRPSPKTTVAYACPSAGWLRGHVCGKRANVEYQLR